MKLDSVKSLLSGSPFAKHAGDIDQVFDLLKIRTLNDLDNAPRLLGPRIAGYSTFQVCAYIRRAAIDRAIAEPIVVEVPEPEPAPKPKKKVKAEVGPKPEETKTEERSDD